MSIKLFSGECKFIFAQGNNNNFPVLNIPEIAFWGRSNVGKSTLLNKLVNRKNMFRISSVPGKTQTINFFKVENKEEKIVLVDMPGYGYMKINKEKASSIEQLNYSYLNNHSFLQAVFLLIDSRIGLQNIDKYMFNYLDKVGQKYYVVLTKTDLINKTKLVEVMNTTKEQLTKFLAVDNQIIAVSAKKNIGIINLQELIYSLIYG